MVAPTPDAITNRTRRAIRYLMKFDNREGCAVLKVAAVASRLVACTCAMQLYVDWRCHVEYCARWEAGDVAYRAATAGGVGSGRQEST